MKRKISIFLLVSIFAMTPLLGMAQQADVNDNAAHDSSEVIQASPEQNEVSSVEIMALVERLADEGEFENDHAVRVLKLHLTAVDRFEQQKATEKVIKHMGGFLLLLGHQREHALISAAAYDTLKSAAEELTQKWNSVAIVRDGQAQAVVLIAEDADEQVSQAADVLVDYVMKSTGAELPLITEEEMQGQAEHFDDVVRIYIGNSAPGNEAHIEEVLQNLDDEGFLIHPNKDRVTIVGPTAWGTLFGVYDFLERYVGVRWLLPGPAGEDVPQLTDLRVPREEVREEPAFSYRQVSPVWRHPNQPDDNQMLNVWGQRNKFQGDYNRPIEFIHNLHALFPPEKYGETHPEFYPDGNPPEPGVGSGWQPCFSEEGTVDVAVAEIIAYFEENPDEPSISLGVNDIGGFCEADPSHPDYPDKRNSTGYVDLSDIYYEWVNKVVEQVTEVYPDKWFGLLAYREVVEPPSFELHPRVVPIITKDRLAWIDEEIRTEDHEQMDDWNDVANQVGWYDYMYGSLYVLPRIYPHQMAEILRYAKQNHVFGFYAEMLPNAGDGPKAWLAAKLMWDPEQDVDALLQDWYERTVGPEAAPDLKAYYDLWEHFWIDRIPESGWFERGKSRVYLSFTDASYVNLVTDEDIAESKRLLNSAVAKAQTDQQKERAKKLRRAFEYYEATALSYPRKTDAPEDESEALSMLDRVTLGPELAQKRHELIEEFADDPILKFRSMPRVDWSGWNPTELWHLVDYVTENEPEGGPVTDQLQALADGDGTLKQREIAQLIEEAAMGPLFSQTVNPSFEEGDETAPPWYRWITSSGTIEQVGGVAYTGDKSLLVDHLERGGPAQTFDVQPGLITSRVHFYTPPGTETNATIELGFHAKNAQGQNLVSIKTDKAQIVDTAGEWASIELLEEVPATVDGKEVTQVQFIATIDGAEDAEMYIDDFVVYQASDDLITAQSFWKLADYIREHETNGGPVYQRVAALAKSDDSSQQRDHARLLLDVITGDSSPLPENSSFEDGSDTAPPWGQWISPSGTRGTIERVEGIARTGNASLLIDNMGRGGPIQTFAVQSGMTAAQIHYYTPIGTRRGTITLSLRARKSNGDVLASFRTEETALSSRAGLWSSLELLEEFPATVDGEEVTHAQMVITVDGGENIQVYVDDAVVHQAGDE